MSRPFFDDIEWRTHRGEFMNESMTISGGFSSKEQRSCLMTRQHTMDFQECDAPPKRTWKKDTHKTKDKRQPTPDDAEFKPSEMLRVTSSWFRKTMCTRQYACSCNGCDDTRAFHAIEASSLAAVILVALILSGRPPQTVVLCIPFACTIAASSGVSTLFDIVLTAIISAIGIMSLYAYIMSHLFLDGVACAIASATALACFLRVFLNREERKSQRFDVASSACIDSVAIALCHSIAIIVLSSAVAPLRRTPFMVFIAAGMPLPAANLLSCRESRCSTRMAFSIVALTTIVGVVWYGVVMFSYDIARNLLNNGIGNSHGTDVVVPMVRAFLTIWYFVSASTPHVLRPFVGCITQYRWLMRVLLIAL